MNVLSDGVKLVLSGVSTVSVVMWSTRPPTATTVRPSRSFSVFSA